MSLEEFLKLEKSDPDHRYEYIDGYPYMMTGGSPDYALIENNVGRILGNLLRRRPCLVYGPDVIFQLSGKDRFSPDLSVSCDICPLFPETSANTHRPTSARLHLPNQLTIRVALQAIQSNLRDIGNVAFGLRMLVSFTNQVWFGSIIDGQNELATAVVQEEI